MEENPDVAFDQATRLLAEVRKHVPLLTFNPDAGIESRAICGAGLARALALIDAISILEENDRDDVTGNLARAVLETHHVALYALLGGNDALDVLRSDHAYHLAGLIEGNPDLWGGDQEELAEIVDEWGSQKKLPFWQLRNDLEVLLRDAGEDVNLRLWYDIMFRGESTYNVHGLGPLTRYIDMTANPYALNERPMPVAKHGSFVTAVVLAGHIALHLFRAQGIGVAPLEERTHALIGTLTSGESP